jgi:hypothetical protein
VKRSPRQRHDHGHVIYILALFVELLLMASLGGGLALQRALWARFQAYSALVLALHAAGAQVELPIGPSGPQLDARRATQTFASVLLADLPAALIPVGAPSVVVCPAGTTDPNTGYRFLWPGVAGRLQFSTAFFGLSLAQIVYADVEVPHGSD